MRSSSPIPALSRFASDAVSDHFKIAVEDTGPGIPPSDQGQIFDEFQQVDNSITRQKGGTGLGLSISRRLVQAHGGQIDVHSTLGVRIYFQYCAAGPCKRTKAGRMSKRILVIEDTENNRRILNDLLTVPDFEVMEANDGEKGVAMAAERKPDLILMDIQLPIVDGYEATRRIKSDPALAEFRSSPSPPTPCPATRPRRVPRDATGMSPSPSVPRVILATVREFLK